MWSSWETGECSVTCGNGAIRTLTRMKAKEASNGGEDCVGVARINIPCNEPDCQSTILPSNSLS